MTMMLIMMMATIRMIITVLTRNTLYNDNDKEDNDNDDINAHDDDVEYMCKSLKLYRASTCRPCLKCKVINPLAL
jgi:hypothetical protein